MAAASTTPQMGGAYDPTKDLNQSGALYCSGTLSAGSTLSVTGASSFTGAATFASTGNTYPFTVASTIATGATGTAAASAPSTYPAYVACNSTGVSGAGLNLPTGACVPGAFYVILNQQTGVVKIYGVGATINGTTGTTAFSLTATGNLTAIASCITAGAWLISGNT